LCVFPAQIHTINISQVSFQPLCLQHSVTIRTVGSGHAHHVMSLVATPVYMSAAQVNYLSTNAGFTVFEKIDDSQGASKKGRKGR
jgi:hypothetical protein